MAYKIEWSPKALLKLDKITIYLEENFSYLEFENYHLQVQRILKLISAFPDAGVLEYSKPLIRSLKLIPEQNLFTGLLLQKLLCLIFLIIKSIHQN